MAITRTTTEAPENSDHSAWNAALQAIFATNPPTFHDGSTDEIRNQVAGLAAGLSHNINPAAALSREGRYGNVAPSHVDMNANVQHAHDFLAHHCNGHWTEAQAMGIVANLIHESGCNPHGPNGDGGQAMGLCQWHADRRAEFERHFNKSFKDSTFDEQLAFIDYEMTEGKEQAAGNMLKQTKVPRNAAAVVSTYYERPADKVGNAAARAGTAAGLVSKLENLDTSTPVALSPDQQIKQFDIAIGDSIAMAAHQAGVPTQSNSAVQGRSPQAVLDYIKSLPKGSLKGKRVLLSTGASNNPTQLVLAEQQVDALLHDAGATSITVLGVGPRSILNGVNQKLEKMLKGKNKIAFSGALPATGSDQVHPGDHEQQVQMVNEALTVTPAEQSQNVADASSGQKPAQDKPLQSQIAEADPRVPRQATNSAYDLLKPHVPDNVPSPTTVANASDTPHLPDYNGALKVDAAKEKLGSEPVKTAALSKSSISPTAVA